jgi:hypothetical protein
MKTLKVSTLILAMAVAGFANSAYAVSSPSVRYSTDGITWQTIAGTGNTVTTTTTTTYNGWVIVNVSGDVLGTPSGPTMDLNSLDVSAGAGAGNTLYIEISATGFGPTDGGITAHIGGILGDSLTWSGYVDGGDTLFASTTTLFSNANVNLNVPASANATGTINLPASYSLTEEFAITQHGGVVYSLDGEIKAVPDGGRTVALLGLALVAFAGGEAVRRKLAGSLGRER